MDNFCYKNDQLYAEDIAVSDIVAQYQTPLYIYSKTALEQSWHAFDRAFGRHPHLICFAVKSNSNLGVLNIMAQLGSGFDIVSQGELERVLVAGGDPKKVVFSGVAKSEREIARGLEVGIRCFNIESEAELQRVNQVAKSLQKVAPISVRVNPDVNPKTHPYISTGLKENKFGISIRHAREVYRQAQQLSHINIVGMDCHIGSQLTEISPFLVTVERLILLMEELKQEGIILQHLDLGGGLGITYSDETPPSPTEYTQALLATLMQYQDLEIIIEPGRAITANAGILVTKVEYIKQNEERHFAIMDTGMNDMIRPALYDAYMQLMEVDRHLKRESQLYDVVGPICETADFLGKQRKLAIAQGDLIAIRSAGAYGATMASNYNSRPKAAEVIVDKNQVHLVRRRESFADLWQYEQMINQ